MGNTWRWKQDWWCDKNRVKKKNKKKKHSTRAWKSSTVNISFDTSNLTLGGVTLIPQQAWYLNQLTSTLTLQPVSSAWCRAAGQWRGRRDAASWNLPPAPPWSNPSAADGSVKRQSGEEKWVWCDVEMFSTSATPQGMKQWESTMCS